MKKIYSILFLIMISVILLSCTNKDCEIEFETEVSIIVPNGTPYFAIASLLENENIKIEAVAGPSNLQSALVSGSHDIVIAPVNLGVNLYNKGNSKYLISHVLTSNNAYIVTRDENKLDNIYDLNGQKVIGFAPTGIPANILKKAYQENNLDINNVDFQYQSSANVYSVFASDTTETKYALMSEPEISKLIINDGLKIKKLDLCEVLGVNIAQACVFVNPESVNQKDIDKVLKLIENSVIELNNNPSEYVEKIVNLDRTFSATGKEVLVQSLPNSNIIFKDAKTNKEMIVDVLNLLGVTLPNEEFYR